MVGPSHHLPIPPLKPTTTAEITTTVFELQETCETAMIDNNFVFHEGSNTLDLHRRTFHGTQQKHCFISKVVRYLLPPGGPPGAFSLLAAFWWLLRFSRRLLVAFTAHVQLFWPWWLLRLTWRSLEAALE